MREFTIDRQSAGKRLDRWLAAAAPSLPAGLMQKYLRLSASSSTAVPPPGTRA